MRHAYVTCKVHTSSASVPPLCIPRRTPFASKRGSSLSRLSLLLHSLVTPSSKASGCRTPLAMQRSDTFGVPSQGLESDVLPAAMTGEGRIWKSCTVIPDCSQSRVFTSAEAGRAAARLPCTTTAAGWPQATTQQSVHAQSSAVHHDPRGICNSQGLCCQEHIIKVMFAIAAPTCQVVQVLWHAVRI